jgi:hypothetical protein
MFGIIGSGRQSLFTLPLVAKGSFQLYPDHRNHEFGALASFNYISDFYLASLPHTVQPDVVPPVSSLARTQHCVTPDS